VALHPDGNRRGLTLLECSVFFLLCTELVMSIPARVEALEKRIERLEAKLDTFITKDHPSEPPMISDTVVYPDGTDPGPGPPNPVDEVANPDGTDPV